MILKVGKMYRVRGNYYQKLIKPSEESHQGWFESGDLMTVIKLAEVYHYDFKVEVYQVIAKDGIFFMHTSPDEKARHLEEI